MYINIVRRCIDFGLQYRPKASKLQLHGLKASKSHQRLFAGALANANFRAISCQVFDFVLDRSIDRLVGAIFVVRLSALLIVLMT